ncbi:hypothetical protein D5S17_36055 [Pseudonocardiaceae bacterium YIM PH 21723]|nr:hypothetical protein D5S17_36055 [Pseudonocardiaceae bacterium YIM PH 21723]
MEWMAKLIGGVLTGEMLTMEIAADGTPPGEIEVTTGPDTPWAATPASGPGRLLYRLWNSFPATCTVEYRFAEQLEFWPLTSTECSPRGHGPNCRSPWMRPGNHDRSAPTT